jgi:hypothetical protein
LQESVVHTFPSSQLTAVPLHTPPEHTSPAVQASPSLQNAELSAYTHPKAESQRSSVQGFWSSQSGGWPPRHVPPEQASPVVQAFPSLHGLALLMCVQPRSESQTSSVQTFASSQSGGGPPTHAPLEQASFVVQALPSVHALVLLTCVQPKRVSHPSSVQPFPSSQSGGGPGTQDPPEQVSLVVQAFPSLHGLVLFTF